MKYYVLLLFASLILSSCGNRVPLDVNFYNDKKIGVVLLVDSISRIKSGSQGNLDKTISSGSKYKDALKLIGTKTYPKTSFLEITQRKFTEKKKPFLIINDYINFKSLQPFIKNDTVDKGRFFDKDLRPLKEKFNVDQFMIVKVKYGLNINYYSMIETSKGGLTTIEVNIVDLKDNSLMFKDKINVYEVFTGKWNNPPHYNELHDNINKSIITALQYYESKF